MFRFQQFVAEAGGLKRQQIPVVVNLMTRERPVAR
jgi:hypothetical protein